MRVLVVEDDFISRKLLTTLLGHYGSCDVAVDGVEAVSAFKMALAEGAPYDLICLDIMMPNMDGQEALKEIRAIEKEKGGEVKVIMVTALDDPKNVVESLYEGGAASYIVKPIDKKKLIDEVKKLGLLD
jgi:two-component system chemotaxis response regulator CheY